MMDKTKDRDTYHDCGGCLCRTCSSEECSYTCSSDKRKWTPLCFQERCDGYERAEGIEGTIGIEKGKEKDSGTQEKG